VPDRGTVRVGFEAVDVIVTVPLAAPDAVGAKLTVNVALCPAVRVTGVVIPLTVNPVPLTLTCETVTLDPPVLVIVSDKGSVLPTVTLPKLRLVGFEVNAPAAIPVADSGIVRVGLEAVEVTVTLPVTLPAAVGVNFTDKVVLCPAVSVKGVVIPLSVNPVPVTLTCETVTLEPPVLVIVSDRD